MNDNLEDQLVTNYPTLFSLAKTQKETCVRQGWYGIDTSDQWYDLINRMCEELQDYPVFFRQIKQKFALLRVDIGIRDIEADIYAEVQDIIAKYELLSRNTCEGCGTEDETVKGNVMDGWYSRRCSLCIG